MQTWLARHASRVTSRVSRHNLKPFQSRYSNSQVQILRNSNGENFSKFWFGDWPSLSLWPVERKQKKEKQQRFACLYLIHRLVMKINKYKNKIINFKNPGNQTPCHSTFSGGIICGSHRGSFSAVQFGDHFRSGDHLRRCTCLDV